MERIIEAFEKVSNEPLHGQEFYTQEMKQQLILKLKEIIENELKGIEEGTDIEKIIRINNFVKKNVKLNATYSDAMKLGVQIKDNQLKYRTAAAALCEGEAICTGITELTRILLQYANVKSHTHLALLPDSRYGNSRFKPFFHYLTVVECKMEDGTTRKIVMDPERQANRERKGKNYTEYMDTILVVTDPPIKFLNNKVGETGLGEECDKISTIKTARVSEIGGLASELENERNEPDSELSDLEKEQKSLESRKKFLENEQKNKQNNSKIK